MVEREALFAIPVGIGRSQREIISIKLGNQIEVPTDPQKRFKAIFSAIGNSEAQCLVFLLFDQAAITKWYLFQRFLKASGQDPLSINQGNIASYCRASFIKNGLLTEANILYKGATKPVPGFQLTEAGLKYQPIAAFLLEESLRLPYSLWQIFGRAPFTRAKILEVLSLASSSQKEEDIAELVGLDKSVVSRHFWHLAGLGLVNKIRFKNIISLEGRKIVSDILLPIKQVLAGNDELLYSWKEIPWQNYVERVILKWQETSESTKRSSQATRKEEVLAALKANPGLRHKDIWALLKRQPTDILRKLREEGMVRVEQKGKTKLFFAT